MQTALRLATMVLALAALARPIAAADRLAVQLRWEPQFQFAGYYAALWQGYYAAAGLDVELRSAVRPDGSVIEATAAVQAGDADIGIGATDILVANDGGERLSVLASIFQHSAMRIYVRPELHATQLQDLALLRAHAGATTLAMVEFQALLAAEGMDPGLLSGVQPEARSNDDFLEGRVDVQPQYSIGMDWTLARRGMNATILDPARFGVDFYGDSIFARTAAVHADPDLYRRFVEATLHGWQYAFAHPEELSRRIVEDFERVYPQPDLYAYNLFQARQLRELAQYGIAELGNTSQFRWQRLNGLLQRAGFTTRPLDDDFVIAPHELVAEEHSRMLHWLPAAAAGLVVAAALIGLVVLSLKRKVRRRTAELRQINARLAEQAELLLDAEEIAKLGHWRVDVATGAMHWSRQVFLMHGLDPDGAVPTLKQALALQHPEDRKTVLRKLHAAHHTGATLEFGFRLLRPDGSVRYLTSKCRRETDGGGRADAIFGTLMDVTDKTLADQRIEHLAYHDALTGLPNRVLFQDRLQMALAGSRRTSGHVAVLMLDLDGFKLVNDTYGHPAGDVLLRAVAERLRTATRETDTICRLGGDEFTVLLTNLAEPADAERIAAKIIAAVGAPVDLDGTALRPRASVGVCVADDATAGALMSNADIALYRAKNENPGGWVSFRPAMRTEADALAHEVEAIRHGLARGEFVLHWQPIFCARTLAYRGSEILVRWQRPGQGLLPPGAFLPAARAGGLMDDLDAWILGAALAERVAAPAAALRDGFVSVNISGDLLTSTAMRDEVLAVIDRYRGDDLNLILEVTENVALDRHVETAAATLRELAARGAAIALDDFGTGHGTLSDLRRFPIHVLKIDREFVDRVDHRADSRAIVASVVGLARAMGITTIGEGIERTDEMQRLAELGCDLLQGYHLGRPMPRDALVRELAQNGGSVAARQARIGLPLAPMAAAARR